MGIEKKVHRLAVLSAIERLKELQEKKKGGEGKEKENAMLQSSDSIMDIVPETKKENLIDVFISYRRQGGSVLAHLLRRELQMSGLFWCCSGCVGVVASFCFVFSFIFTLKKKNLI